MRAKLLAALIRVLEDRITLIHPWNDLSDEQVEELVRSGVSPFVELM